MNIFLVTHIFGNNSNFFSLIIFDLVYYCSINYSVYFFLSGFSFTNIHDSQESKGRTRLQSVTKYLRLKLVCMWNCRFSYAVTWELVNLFVGLRLHIAMDTAYEIYKSSTSMNIVYKI